MSDIVQSFRSIALLLAKWILILAIALLSLVAGLVGIFYGYNWYTYDRHAEKIRFTVSVNAELCKEQSFPLFVGIVNNSSKTLNKASFTLVAKRKGFSSNLATYNSSTDDKIRKPKEGYGACWSFPTLEPKGAVDPKTLEWSVTYTSFIFAN